MNLLWPIVDSKVMSMTIFGLSCVASAIGYAGAAAIVQDIVPNQMRGKAMAVYMLVMGLAGYALDLHASR